MSAEPHRILVCDDNESHRDLAAGLLRREGYAVDLTADGDEVLQALAARAYGLLLLDIGMPGLNGLQAARQIRDLPGSGGRLPIVAITGHAMPGDRERCLAAGMDDYLSKPVATADLMAIVWRWLGRPEPAVTNAASSAVIDDRALERLADQTSIDILPSLVGTFVTEVGSRSSQIAAALATTNWDELERQAHALKSASHSFGAVRLAHLLEAIETACVDGNTVRAASLAGDVPALADAVVYELSQRF